MLLAAKGLRNTEIAHRQSCSLPTAGPRRQRTGRRAKWRPRPDSVNRRSAASGALFGSNRIAPRPSSYRAIRSSSTRCATIVGLYLAPPDRALVLCVDEKSQIQALDRTVPLLPMRPGQTERRTHDYTRHGTTSLFAALDTKTGNVIGQMQRRHRSTEFRAFLDTLERNVPGDLDIHLILGNDGTHKRS